MNISITFICELNDFLKPGKRGKVINYPIKGNQTVKHIIEALGVPHPEVGEIFVNQKPVDFFYIVVPDDEVEVFPVSGNKQLLQRTTVQNGIVLSPRFILDNHLGKLAIYLRMMGFDTLYQNNYQDNELARIASIENRLLLTRDRGLLMRNSINFGYCIRHLNPKEQLAEVVDRFKLHDKIQPFHRCLCCNFMLNHISKQKILHRLEPLTRLYYDEFHHCSNCDRIYWKGSHYDRMAKLLEEIIQKGEVQ